MRGGRAIKAQLVARLCRMPTGFVLWFGVSQKRPTNLDRRVSLQQFGDLNGVQRGAFEQLVA
jgi:hypothetical protein